VNSVNTFWAKLDLGSKEVNALDLVERAVNEGWLDDALLALCSLEQALSETGTCHGHRECGRPCTVFCLDDLVTTELDAVDQRVELVAYDIGVTGLGDQRYDSDTRVAANDGDVLIGRVGGLDLGDETGGADDIEGSDTEQTLWIVDTLALEDFGKISDDRTVGVEQIY
jgi:hypothetical protein